MKIKAEVANVFVHILFSKLIIKSVLFLRPNIDEEHFGASKIIMFKSKQLLSSNGLCLIITFLAMHSLLIIALLPFDVSMSVEY